MENFPLTTPYSLWNKSTDVLGAGEYNLRCK